MEERQASRQHRVILTNRGTCALNGISDILSFDVNEILLETEMGMLMIRGIDLHVNRLTLEKGETDAVKLVEAMKKNIETEPLAKIDYIKAVDGLTMQQVTELKSPVLVAMAVYIGKTRLIDNFVC